jgi:phosphoribosyl-AMP cyclohydrolase
VQVGGVLHGLALVAIEQSTLRPLSYCLMNSPNPTPDFSKGDGLLPAIAQDAATGEVLMLGYMNRDAWDETLATGRAVYYSRSRSRLWRKGEESGHVQHVRSIHIDCDADTILLKVEQVGGAACHEGYLSCFFRRWDGAEFTVEGERVFDPQQIYRK